MTITVTEEINFDIDGKFISYLKIPYSTNSSGWGSLMMPLIVIRNGKGKKILFTGGNH